MRPKPAEPRVPSALGESKPYEANGLAHEPGSRCMFDANYGWYEIRVFNGDTDDPIIDRIRPIQTWLTNAVVPDDPGRVALLAIGIGTAVATIVRRRRTTELGIIAD